jgi:type VI secretion system protein VasJ
MPLDPAIQALATSPIPGDAPTGQSSRYEPEFEHMQAEIDKLTALSGAAPDWNAVISDATTLLTGKTKDLMVASYLCAGLRETRGWPGLTDGLNLIKEMLAAFWEGLHPGKLRARKAAIDWLLDRMKIALETVAVQSSDGESVEASIAVIDQLAAFGEGRWENDPPTVWSLSQILKEKLSAIPAEAPAEAQQDAAGGHSGAAGGAASGSGATLSHASAPAGRADAYRQIVAAADYLIAVEPHSPVPYLLRRAASWGGMALPQLYVELQKTGSAWDLVLGGLPEGSQASASSASTAPASETPSTRPVRGDF